MDTELYLKVQNKNLGKQMSFHHMLERPYRPMIREGQLYTEYYP
jgi:hypothetical protein